MFVCLFVACKSRNIVGCKLPDEKPLKSSQQISFHSYVMNRYFSEFDYSDWDQKIKLNLHNIEDNGVFNEDKFKLFFMNNYSLFVNNMFLEEKLKQAFELYNINISMDEYRKKLLTTEDIINTSYGNDLIVLDENTSKRNFLLNSRVINRADSFIHSKVADILFNQTNSPINYLLGCINSLNYYRNDKNISSEYKDFLDFCLDDLQNVYNNINIYDKEIVIKALPVDDMVYSIDMAKYAPFCQICGPEPYGISHQEHINLAEVNAVGFSIRAYQFRSAFKHYQNLK